MIYNRLNPEQRFQIVMILLPQENQLNSLQTRGKLPDMIGFLVTKFVDRNLVIVEVYTDLSSDLSPVIKNCNEEPFESHFRLMTSRTN